MSDSFFALTPEAVLAAVEAGGYQASGHVTPLTCLENRVFDVRLESGRHVVAKFYRPGRWSREAILEEHALLGELRAAEIPVCAPLTFGDGATLHVAEGIHYAVWPRTGGRAPDEFSDEQIDVVGRLLARIHNVGALADAPHRPRLDAAVVRDALAVLEASFLPAACARRSKRSRKSMRSGVGACRCTASTAIAMRATCCEPTTAGVFSTSTTSSSARRCTTCG